LTTHVLEIAEQLCHRVGIVTAGEMVAIGSLDDLRQQAQREAASLEELFLQLTDGTEG
jgi:ABC-2 type transport system ATP-binding protein